METIIFSLIFVGIVWILPILMCGWIAKERKRSKAKGQLVGVLTGWLGVICLYLGLKRRGTKKDGSFYLY